MLKPPHTNCLQAAPVKTILQQVQFKILRYTSTKHYFRSPLIRTFHPQQLIIESTAPSFCKHDLLDNEVSYQLTQCIQSSIQFQLVIKGVEELKRSFKPQCLRSHSSTLHLFSYWLVPRCLWSMQLVEKQNK